MAKLFQIKRVNGVTDDAVKAKTGKKWEEWFKVLDRAGARMMDHQEIRQFAQEQLGLTIWWSRLLTLGYEQDRGVRQKHQRGSRFEVDRSKTLAAPLAVVWQAWHDETVLARWMPGITFQFAKATPDRTLHLDWPGDTHVVVVFSEKAGKTKVIVSHERLRNAEDVARLQEFWSAALERLKDVIAEGASR